GIGQRPETSRPRDHRSGSALRFLVEKGKVRVDAAPGLARCAFRGGEEEAGKKRENKEGTGGHHGNKGNESHIPIKHGKRSGGQDLLVDRYPFANTIMRNYDFHRISYK